MLGRSVRGKLHETNKDNTMARRIVEGAGGIPACFFLKGFVFISLENYRPIQDVQHQALVNKSDMQVALVGIIQAQSPSVNGRRKQ